MFYTLEENRFLSAETTKKMIKAVGLRNLLVHAYGKIDLKRFFKVIHDDIGDLNGFLAEIFQKLDLRDSHSASTTNG